LADPKMGKFNTVSKMGKFGYAIKLTKIYNHNRYSSSTINKCHYLIKADNEELLRLLADLDVKVLLEKLITNIKFIGTIVANVCHLL
jgi:hypothetical protein